VPGAPGMNRRGFIVFHSLRIAMLASAAIFLAGVNEASAANATTLQIECQRAKQALADQPPGGDALLAAWKSNEGKCKGTGVYEIELASIYSDRNEFDQARQALHAAAIPENLKKQAEISEITIDYLQAVASGEPARLSAVEKTTDAFTQTSPENVDVLSMLGHTRVLLGKSETAIAPLEAVIKHGDGMLGDYRNLTIAYANAGQYPQALELLDKTYAMSQAVTSDEEFMYAATLAYAATGKVDSAKNMLTLIASKKPQLLHDPKFQRTVQKAKELSHGELK